MRYPEFGGVVTLLSHKSTTIFQIIRALAWLETRQVTPVSGGVSVPGSV